MKSGYISNLHDRIRKLRNPQDFVIDTIATLHDDYRSKVHQGCGLFDSKWEEAGNAGSLAMVCNLLMYSMRNHTFVVAPDLDVAAVLKTRQQRFESFFKCLNSEMMRDLLQDNVTIHNMLSELVTFYPEYEKLIPSYLKDKLKIDRTWHIEYTKLLSQDVAGTADVKEVVSVSDQKNVEAENDFDSDNDDNFIEFLGEVGQQAAKLCGKAAKKLKTGYEVLEAMAEAKKSEVVAAELPVYEDEYDDGSTSLQRVSNKLYSAGRKAARYLKGSAEDALGAAIGSVFNHEFRDNFHQRVKDGKIHQNVRTAAADVLVKLAQISQYTIGQERIVSEELLDSLIPDMSLYTKKQLAHFLFQLAYKESTSDYSDILFKVVKGGSEKDMAAAIRYIERGMQHQHLQISNRAKLVYLVATQHQNDTEVMCKRAQTITDIAKSIGVDMKSHLGSLYYIHLNELLEAISALNHMECVHFTRELMHHFDPRDYQLGEMRMVYQKLNSTYAAPIATASVSKPTVGSGGAAAAMADEKGVAQVRMTGP